MSFILILLFHLTLAEFPTNPCYLDNEACDTNVNNVIDTITGVSTLEECRASCYSNPLCKFITFYGEDSFPLSNICMILSSCDETFHCDGCHSEDSFCFRQLIGNNERVMINLSSYPEIVVTVLKGLSVTIFSALFLVWRLSMNVPSCAEIQQAVPSSPSMVRIIREWRTRVSY